MKKCWLRLNNVIALFALTLAAITCLGADDASLRWTSVDVTSGEYSGDAHLLELPDSSVWMIDAGYARFAKRSLVPMLKARSIDKIEGVVVTHAHLNHYEGVAELINAGIDIGVLYFTETSTAVCESETWNGGCRTEHVQEFLRRVREANISIVPIPIGKSIFAKDQLELSVIHQSVNNDMELLGFTVNDTSAILKLTYGDNSILFPGDIGGGAGRWLMENKENLASDILVIPHHGLDQTVSDSFFETVAPKFAIATAPQQQWSSHRGKRVKAWFERNSIPVYVSGIHGDVTVVLTGSHPVDENIRFSGISD